MTRWTAVLGLVLGMGLAGCAAMGPEEVGSGSDELRGRSCMSSEDCSRNQYCSVEDGDCFSSCPPGAICTAVCTGVCKRDDRARCGSGFCAPGDVCCNDSCGICTPPDGVCTQQLCSSTETL